MQSKTKKKTFHQNINSNKFVCNEKSWNSTFNYIFQFYARKIFLYTFSLLRSFYHPILCFKISYNSHPKSKKFFIDILSLKVKFIFLFCWVKKCQVEKFEPRFFFFVLRFLQFYCLEIQIRGTNWYFKFNILLS